MSDDLGEEFYIQTSRCRGEDTYTWLCSKPTARRPGAPMAGHNGESLNKTDEARFVAAGIKSSRLEGWNSPKRTTEKILRAVAALRKFEET